MVPEKMLEAKRNGILMAGSSGPRILARSFYRELREGGFSPQQILAASNELIDLVTQDIREGANASDEKGAA